MYSHGERDYGSPAFSKQVPASNQETQVRRLYRQICRVLARMRKHQLLLATSTPASGQSWLDIERIASVEVTSEEDGYPLESALLEKEHSGWRAAVSPEALSTPLARSDDISD